MWPTSHCRPDLASFAVLRPRVFMRPISGSGSSATPRPTEAIATRKSQCALWAAMAGCMPASAKAWRSRRVMAKSSVGTSRRESRRAVSGRDVLPAQAASGGPMTQIGWLPKARAARPWSARRAGRWRPLPARRRRQVFHRLARAFAQRQMDVRMALAKALDHGREQQIDHGRNAHFQRAAAGPPFHGFPRTAGAWSPAPASRADTLRGRCPWGGPYVRRGSAAARQLPLPVAGSSC